MQPQGIEMKTTTLLAVALGVGALAACNKSPTEQAAENVESNYANVAENVEATTTNAAESIEAQSVRSQAIGVDEIPAALHAARASSIVRARPMICAPLAASAFMVSSPMPDSHPVTTIRLRVRSTPAST